MAATHTPYYNLNKPDRQDFVSVVTDINDNMDKIDTALHGKASLDGSGKVPASELPSYVDDVIEGYLYNGQFYKESSHTTLITPEGDKIYVDIPTSSSYRWSGSLYVKIDDPKEIIDDNAGIGDTDLVYSADKVVKLFRSEHEDLTSGNAEQVIGKVASTEKGAYLYRRGMHLGNRCREKVVGGTVAWNQVFPKKTLNYSGTGYTLVSNNDGVFTLTIASNGTSTDGANVFSVDADVMKANHVYYLTTANDDITMAFKGYAKQWKNDIFKITTPAWSNIALVFSNLNAGAYVFKPQLFDLTQMFGLVIADTLYGMGEAGVQWFRNLFPKDYYAYDAGTLMSVQAASKQTVGFNVWDEEWELGAWDATTGAAWSVTDRIRSKNFIPCLPSMNYFYNKPDGHKSRVLFYNAQKEYLGEYVSYDYLDTFTTPSNCYYFRFNTGGTYGTTYKNDICFNIYNPAKNGTYEPYSGHTYPFDSNLVLRGIPKLDSNNRLYYDGDEYESSGKVTRKYGIVDLGTLDWAEYSSPQSHIFRSYSINDAKVDSNLNPANAIIAKYTIKGYTPLSQSDNKCYGISVFVEGWHNTISLVDYDYSDSAAFKTAMSGVYLVYELATPTTEQASPFTPIMSFDPVGTEEFTEWGTRDVAIPVGHITEYLTDPAKILNNIPLIEVEKESASVVTFSDGAEGLPLKELTVKVEPVQDLHGYDNPWPAGGGKNQVNPVNWANSSNNQVTYTVDKDKGTITITGTASVNSYAEYDLSNLQPNTAYILTGAPSGSSESSTYNLQVQGLGTAVKDTGSGASFTTGSDVSGLKLRVTVYQGTAGGGAVFKPMVRLSSISDATFAPYSNICPISGWTGAKVTRTGFNLINKSTITHGYFVDGNNNSAPSSDWAHSDYIQVKGGETYYYTIPQYVGVNKIFEYDSNKNVIGKLNGGVSAQTLDEKCCYVRLNMKETDVDNACFNVSDPAKNGTYETYQPIQTVTIDLNGTRYGGKLTVNKDGSGELVVDRGKYIQKDATNVQALQALTSVTRITTAFPISAKSIVAKQAYSISNYLPNVIDYTLDSPHFYTSDTTIVAFYPGVMTGDQWRAYVAEHPLEIVYFIENPITIDLSPVEVTTLLGINNLWSDTGDIALTYRADTKKYIDAKIAELSAAITALGT